MAADRRKVAPRSDRGSNMMLLPKPEVPTAEPESSALCGSANWLHVVDVDVGWRGHKTRDKTESRSGSGSYLRSKRTRRKEVSTFFKAPYLFYLILTTLLCAATLLQFIPPAARQAQCAATTTTSLARNNTQPQPQSAASDLAARGPKKSAGSQAAAKKVAVLKATSLIPGGVKPARQSWPVKQRLAESSQQEELFNGEQQKQRSDLQLSITARVGLVRVPVESNAILKCLISSQSANNKLTKKFDIHWSRYMYDENVYEQIESFGNSNAFGSVYELSDNSSSTSEQADQTLQVSANNQVGQEVLVNRQQQLRDFLNRARQETNNISDLLIEATLSISPVKATDNATYYCTATDGLSEQSQARVDLVALSRPVVALQRVFPARDSKSALISWLVISDGNTPIKRTILMVRNDTAFNSATGRQQQQQQQQQVDTFEQSFSSSVVLDSDYNQWQRIDISGDGEPEVAQHWLNQAQPTGGYSGAGDLGGDSVVRADLDASASAGAAQIPAGGAQVSPADARWRWRNAKLNRAQRAYNLSALLPGVTYNFRLAAINDMGQSNWSYLSSTMPNEIPAQIGEMFLLSRLNDSLAIGWRRPAWDNAKTIRYEMQLFDLNRTLTLDANTNTSLNSPAQTKFMYIFVNLNPGTDYHFHVRACSRAGCSAFSTPKLLASTLDGEPDEPLDVEFTCHLSTSAEESINNVSVSWLPPVNARGQLLNYSVAFDSYARYRNASGHWQVDEWRSSLETGDNHTLSVDTRAILQANTNYTVRVCANNRSKHCGKLSSLSARTQCATRPELPAQLPADIKLTFQTDNPKAAIPNNSLVLELPFISQRNGSLDCIQVILIRLPDSFNSSSGASSMAAFLPKEARDIKISAPVELQATEANQAELAASRNNQAIAYLAEEVDQSSWWPAKRSTTSGDSGDQSNVVQSIILGDGLSQLGCPDHAQTSPKARQVYDAKLKPSAYYTGFIKILLTRSSPQDQARETLVKYSDYFTPVRTGEIVLEAIEPNYSSNAGADSNANRSAFSLFRSLGSSQMSFQEIALQLGSNVRSSLSKLYNSSSTFVLDNVRLEALGNMITRSSPLMQVLELGIIVLMGSLLILLVVYVVSLPSAARRKRARKTRRQLDKHQEASGRTNTQAAYRADNGTLVAGAPATSVPANPPSALALNQNGAYVQQQQQAIVGAYQHAGELTQHQNHLHHQQQEPSEPLANYNTTGHTHRECPIHSSPSAAAANHLQRSPAHFSEHQQVLAHHNHHHHHHHQQLPARTCLSNQVDQYAAAVNQQQHSSYQQQQVVYANHEQHYERNCRTARRAHNAIKQADYADDLRGLNGSGLATAAAKNQLTLGSQSSVLALAKKINKSIPLRLFGNVFECRLRNNWLRDEYEQLPRPQLWPATTRSSSLLLKLRSQLIVSRNDSVSALISGNDLFDAGRVSMRVPGTSGVGEREKSIICAKSPLDADSVWDFWRLVYEQEVSTIVMLTQNEDPNTGELRCAQYWPTCDNEETTILSPCNEFVQKSAILPAKFKIRQETLSSDELTGFEDDSAKVRQLTLIVMATKPGENEAADESQQTEADGNTKTGDDNQEKTDEPEEDEESLIIVERTILHLQFCCWNTSTLANQMRLIKFIETANERHTRSLQALQESPNSSDQTINNPMLVHCANGLGRSGLFAAMSFVIDDLSAKLSWQLNEMQSNEPHQHQQQSPRLNLFQLVACLRSQREMLLSPYRLYELLYQLTSNCIPIQERPQPLPLLHQNQQTRQSQPQTHLQR